MGKIRPSTEYKAPSAALSNYGGGPQTEIATKLGVNATRVRRFLRTPLARAVTIDLYNKLAEESYRWHAPRLSEPRGLREQRILANPLIARTLELLAKSERLHKEEGTLMHARHPP